MYFGQWSLWIWLTLCFVVTNVGTSYAQVSSLSDDCNYALQLMLLQDLSGSYNNDLPQLQEFLPVFTTSLIESYPGSVFAVSSFVDYPFPDVGFAGYAPTDYCFKLEADFTADPADIQSAVNNLKILSGRDEPEAQLTALLHLVRGGYFSNNRDLSRGLQDVKVVMLSTDASFHQAGDLAIALSKHAKLFADNNEVVKGLENKFTVRPNDGDGDLSCTGYDMEDYPSEDQIVSALLEENIFLILLVTKKQLAYYTTWQEKLSSRGVDCLVSVIEDDSSDLLKAFEGALRSLHQLVCPTTTTTTTTTTTVPPAIPPATTVAPTTTTTSIIPPPTTTLISMPTSTTTSIALPPDTTARGDSLIPGVTLRGSTTTLPSQGYPELSTTTTTTTTTRVGATPAVATGVIVGAAVGGAAAAGGAAFMAASFFSPSATAPAAPSGATGADQAIDRDLVQEVSVDMFARDTL